MYLLQDFYPVYQWEWKPLMGNPKKIMLHWKKALLHEITDTLYWQTDAPPRGVAGPCLEVDMDQHKDTTDTTL